MSQGAAIRPGPRGVWPENSVTPRGFAGIPALDLTPSVLSFVAVPLDAALGAVTVSLTPSILNFDARPLTPTPGVVTVSATPSALHFVAVALDPVPLPVVVSLTPAVLHFDARPLTPAPGMVTINLSPAILHFGAQSFTPVPGMVTISLTPAILHFDAQALNPTLPPVSVSLAPAVLHLSAQVLDPAPGVVTISLTPAALHLSAQVLDPTPGVVMVSLIPAALHLSAQAFDPTPGVVTVTLAPTTLHFGVTMGTGVIDLRLTLLTFGAVALDPQPGSVGVNMIINLTSPNFAAIVTGVGACVVDGLSQTPAGAPARQCLLVPAQSIPWDDCDCSGQVALAIRGVYGADSFPAAVGTTWAKCSPRYWVARVLVSVVRCVPSMGQDGVPPSCALELAAALTLENDRTAVRQAIACCLGDSYPYPVGAWSIGESVTVGELGGCAGTETEFLVAVRSCPCP